MTDKNTCVCTKCQAERILDFAYKQAEPEAEEERAATALTDLATAISLFGIEYDVTPKAVISVLVSVHAEVTNRLAKAARVAEREARETDKGFVQ